MMRDILKGVGTTEVARDSLNMDVNKPASCVLLCHVICGLCKNSYNKHKL